ncbi:hypothetical protein [Paraburkholderia aromaticivorans]|uniref:hypothetical protein n=1 Tax=Paraburkholderia aromaticivorans TaxID=2026199 RepID=UPI0014561461|nr:hypothetical protein [Paraburkholderia aromaticivorans]
MNDVAVGGRTHLVNVVVIGEFASGRARRFVQNLIELNRRSDRELASSVMSDGLRVGSKSCVQAPGEALGAQMGITQQHADIAMAAEVREVHQ